MALSMGNFTTIVNEYIRSLSRENNYSMNGMNLPDDVIQITCDNCVLYFGEVDENFCVSVHTKETEETPYENHIMDITKGMIGNKKEDLEFIKKITNEYQHKSLEELQVLEVRPLDDEDNFSTVGCEFSHSDFF